MFASRTRAFSFVLSQSAEKSVDFMVGADGEMEEMEEMGEREESVVVVEEEEVVVVGVVLV